MFWGRVAVEGLSMVPTLAPGDWLVVRRSRRLRRGDLVVVRRPDGLFVKRLTGLPGDAGLGPDDWWVTGDNEVASDDSRRFGPVRRADLVARVVWRYWPPGAWGRVR